MWWLNIGTLHLLLSPGDSLGGTAGVFGKQLIWDMGKGGGIRIDVYQYKHRVSLICVSKLGFMILGT